MKKVILSHRRLLRPQHQHRQLHLHLHPLRPPLPLLRWHPYTHRLRLRRPPLLRPLQRSLHRPTLPLLSEVGATGDGDLAKLVQQRRIVVRTVHMALVVSNIQTAMDKVASLAANMGGWTVSSERANDFGGKIAVRVPAERLDEAIGQVRSVAVAVESEITTSKDVTAEYFDSQSRLRNLRATETAMLNLLEQAPNARDALEIRRTLSEVQEEIEVLLGRLKLLEETSAFSLVNVSMRVERVDLRVDAGEDRTVSIGQTVRFKAKFRAPRRVRRLQSRVELRRPL